MEAEKEKGSHSLACHAMRSLRRALRVLPRGFATFHDGALQLGGGGWDAEGAEPAVLRASRTRPARPAPATLGGVLRREKLAMAACHAALLYDGHPYGGYVRDLASGMPFEDVDICFDNAFSIRRFKDNLVTLLHRILGHAKHVFELLLVDKSRTPMPRRRRDMLAYTFTVHRHLLRWEGTVVRLDLTHLRHFEHCHRVPATLGSRLQWTPTEGITFMHCNASEDMRGSVDVEELCRLLAAGKDIPCFPACEQWSEMKEGTLDATQRYYDTKHRQLTQRGYTMLMPRGVALAGWRQLMRRSNDNWDRSDHDSLSDSD